MIVVLLVALFGAGSVMGQAMNRQQAALEEVISVELDGVPAENALQWFAARTGINLVVNWDRLEQAGYDRAAPVSLQLNNVPGRVAMRLLLADIFNSDEVMAEITPHFVRIRTREQLNEEPVVKIYDIGDLLMSVPNFDGAPKMSLDEVIGDNESGSGGNLFDEVEADDEASLTKSERVENIINAITTNIEPDIWQRNGGISGTITYFQNKLIIRAPEYVHQKIGDPIPPAPVPSVASPLRNASISRAAPARGAYPANAGNYVNFSSGGPVTVDPPAADAGGGEWRSDSRRERVVQPDRQRYRPDLRPVDPLGQISGVRRW
jgi:hypothetical protein